MVLMDCSECKGKVSDKASTCPHCGCPLRYSANATTDLTTDSSGEEEIGTESRRLSQGRQNEYHIYKEVNGNVFKDTEVAQKQYALAILVGGIISIIFTLWFVHGGSFDWFSTEPEAISLKEFVKKTPSTYDDLSLDRRLVKDIAVIKSINSNGSHVDEIKSTISGVEYVFDILGRQVYGTSRLAPGDKIEFTALVDARSGRYDTDRNLRGFWIERVISMVSHIDCTRCAGSGIIVTGKHIICAGCGGDGILGLRECTNCDGEGNFDSVMKDRDPCSDCQGSGLVVPRR